MLRGSRVGLWTCCGSEMVISGGGTAGYCGPTVVACSGGDGRKEGRRDESSYMIQGLIHNIPTGRKEHTHAFLADNEGD